MFLSWINFDNQIHTTKELRVAGFRLDYKKEPECQIAEE